MTALLDGSQLRRRLVLCSLAGWASLLSLETLLRQPGFAPAATLPPQLRLDGVLYARRPASPLQQDTPQLDLPPGVVRLAAARYGEHSVLLLGHTRSGASGQIPVEAINTALSRSPKGGRCLVVDGAGDVRAELGSAADWLAWRRAHPATSAQTLAWLVGLQPRQANLCLWMAM